MNDNKAVDELIEESVHKVLGSLTMRELEIVWAKLEKPLHSGSPEKARQLAKELFNK